MGNEMIRANGQQRGESIAGPIGQGIALEAVVRWGEHRDEVQTGEER
jgi:hypothetical protein